MAIFIFVSQLQITDITDGINRVANKNDHLMKLVILKRLGKKKKTQGCWVLVWVVENKPKIK